MLKLIVSFIWFIFINCNLFVINLLVNKLFIRFMHFFILLFLIYLIYYSYCIKLKNKNGIKYYIVYIPSCHWISVCDKLNASFVKITNICASETTDKIYLVTGWYYLS